MTFKEQLVEDNKGIFMNPDEFSEFHVINGQEMAVQIDGNEMIEREKYRSEIYAEGGCLRWMGKSIPFLMLSMRPESILLVWRRIKREDSFLCGDGQFKGDRSRPGHGKG